MAYVDGYVIPVPKANREAYLNSAKQMSAMYHELGALKVVECWSDDVPEGKVTSFPMAVKREHNENVVFSWIVWPSKEVRDMGNKKLMEDPRMKPGTMEMPFDGKRMIMGGFEVMLEA